MATKPTTTRSRKKDDGLDTLGRKKSPGRGTLLTPEVEAILFANRELGLKIERCCYLAGIHWRTFYDWLETAEKATPKAAGKRTPFEQKCVTFAHAWHKVDSEWLRRCETVLQLTMTPGQNLQAWRDASTEEKRLAAETARWKLSHQAPDEYSTKERTELTGANGGPVEVVTASDVFQALKDAKAAEDEA